MEAGYAGRGPFPFSRAAIPQPGDREPPGQTDPGPVRRRSTGQMPRASMAAFPRSGRLNPQMAQFTRVEEQAVQVVPLLRCLRYHFFAGDQGLVPAEALNQMPDCGSGDGRLVLAAMVGVVNPDHLG